MLCRKSGSRCCGRCCGGYESGWGWSEAKTTAVLDARAHGGGGTRGASLARHPLRKERLIFDSFFFPAQFPVSVPDPQLLPRLQSALIAALWIPLWNQVRPSHFCCQRQVPL